LQIESADLRCGDPIEPESTVSGSDSRKPYAQDRAESREFLG